MLKKTLNGLPTNKTFDMTSLGGFTAYLGYSFLADGKSVSVEDFKLRFLNQILEENTRTNFIFRMESNPYEKDQFMKTAFPGKTKADFYLMLSAKSEELALQIEKWAQKGNITGMVAMSKKESALYLWEHGFKAKAVDNFGEEGASLVLEQVLSQVEASKPRITSDRNSNLENSVVDIEAELVRRREVDPRLDLKLDFKLPEIL